MPDQFQIHIPAENGQPLNLALGVGEAMYLLGANGTGKSSLVSHIYRSYPEHARRISAHRQTWFESNTPDMTPRNRQDVESNVRTQDAQPRSRYWEWNGAQRASLAIYDLINADTMQERKIAAFVRAGDGDAAKKEAESPSPIQVINELMRLSNLPIEISLEEGQRIVARKNGGPPFSVTQLSDGERSAFLIAASVLTAAPGTLIVIDEPERHLHRSIISPLLRLLFGRRKDCAFIVSTHELMLPVDSPEASTLLVRGCEYQGDHVRAWAVDVVPPGTAIDEGLKRDLLGGRRKMLFVEGTAQSLDAPLYSLLFPQVSVIPKDGCRDVEHAVRGLRCASDMHWIAAWGIVDNDQRAPEDIVRLRTAGIWALSHYSVESLYYYPKIIARVAERQAQVTGGDAAALVEAALANAIAAARAQRNHLVISAVLRTARERVLDSLPARHDIEDGGSVNVQVDVRTLRAAEEARFDALVAAADWDGLLSRYPLRESSAFDRVISGIQMTDRTVYQQAVLKVLQDQPEAVAELRNLLGDLHASITA